VYFIAFASLGVQVAGLVGDAGILPADRYLGLVARRLGPAEHRAARVARVGREEEALLVAPARQEGRGAERARQPEVGRHLGHHHPRARQVDRHEVDVGRAVAGAEVGRPRTVDEVLAVEHDRVGAVEHAGRAGRALDDADRHGHPHERRVEVLAIGTKNTQARELEFLARL